MRCNRCLLTRLLQRHAHPNHGLPTETYAPSAPFYPINMVEGSGYGDPTPLTEYPQGGFEQPHNPHVSPPMLETESTIDESDSPATPQRSLMVALRDVNLTNGIATPVASNRSMSARQLKRKLIEGKGRGASGRKLVGEQDPENREILRLRQEHNMDFHEIARYLNKKRVKNGERGRITSNAVYSRYKRNGPLIAAADGKDFVPTERDRKANGKEIAFAKPLNVVGFDDREDQLLVRAVKEVEEKKWEMVAERLREMGGRLHTPDMCAMRYDRI